MNLFHAPSGFFSYNAMPVLVGRLEEKQGGCEMDARYRAPIWARLFYLFWYALLIIFALLAISVPPDDGAGPGGLPILAVLPIFAIIPVAMHYAFSGSEKSLQAILQMLEVEAELTRID